MKARTLTLNEWKDFQLTIQKNAVTLEIQGRIVLTSRSILSGPGFLAIYANEVRSGGHVAYKDFVLKP